MLLVTQVQKQRPNTRNARYNVIFREVSEKMTGCAYSAAEGDEPGSGQFSMEES